MCIFCLGNSLNIIDEIKKSGSITVSRYVELCNAHYYNTRDPFGADGDFTTAPEISQMFGEVIGAWLVDRWMQLGKPSPVQLVELGAGRGTMMSDILRVASKVPEFYEGLKVKILEQSKTLIEVQKKNLDAHKGKIQWIHNLEELEKIPALFVANEFFDALPIQQHVRNGNVWSERKVGIKDDKLCFIPEEHEEIKEASPESEKILSEICTSVKEYGGTALVIDYGYNTDGAKGDTLQAVKNHAYHPVLETPGEADLTAHVNFTALGKVAAKSGCEYSVTTQGEFLKANGIMVRASMLAKGKDDKTKAKILTDVERLVSPDHMGDLFKVLICS